MPGGGYSYRKSMANVTISGKDVEGYGTGKEKIKLGEGAAKSHVGINYGASSHPRPTIDEVANTMANATISAATKSGGGKNGKVSSTWKRRARKANLPAGASPCLDHLGKRRVEGIGGVEGDVGKKGRSQQPCTGVDSSL